MTSTPTIAPPAAAGRGAPSSGAGNKASDADSGAEFAEVVSAVKAEAAEGSEKVSSAKDGAGNDGSAKDGSGQPGAAAGHTGAPGQLSAPGLLKLQAEAALTDVADVTATGMATAPVLPIAVSVAPIPGVLADSLATEAVATATEDAPADELAAAAAAALLAQAALPTTVAADAGTAAETTSSTSASGEIPVAVFIDAGSAEDAAATTADTGVEGLPLPGGGADAEGDLAGTEQERPAPRGVVTSAAPPAVGFSMSAAAGENMAPGRNTALPVAAREPVAAAAAPTSTDSALIFSSLPGTSGVESTSATAHATPGTPAGTAAQLAGAVFSVHRRGVDGTRQLTVDVTPEDLGPIRLTVTVRAGEVHILLGGSSELSREALRQALPELRKVLEEAGVATGSFDVHPDQPDSRPDWAASAGNSHDSNGSRGSRATGSERSPSAAQTGIDASAGRSPRAVALSSDRALDLHL